MAYLCVEQLINNIEVRANLIEIKQILKKEGYDSPLQKELQAHTDVLLNLLSHEDAKVRKNVALIIGEMGADELLSALCDAYEKEETLFVRDSYLEAMGQMDYRPVLPVLKLQLEKIQTMEITPENKKHVTKERHLLMELISLVSDVVFHTYREDDVASKVLLTTKRGKEQLLLDELSENYPDMQKKLMAGGVMVIIKHPNQLSKVRTWQNMLFAFAKDNGFEKSGDAIASGIWNGQVIDYLNQRHEECDGAWKFRVDVKTKDDPKEKTALVKSVAASLEELSSGQLINSVSDYECEFVLTPSKDGRVFVWLKLNTWKDRRFSYRKNYVAASMNPMNAAQMIRACRPYFKDNANVLDPFCGVGTLLLERRLQSGQKYHVRGLYGVDTFGAAVEGGRENAGILNIPVNFIQRDFFEFTHAYLFDEVITDLPDFESEKARIGFYKRFLEKLEKHLNHNAHVFIYTLHGEDLKLALSKNGSYQCLKEIPFAQNKDTSVFVLTYTK